MYRHYVAIDAQQFSELRKSIPRRPRKLSKEVWLEIEQLLKRHWSPETIVGARRRAGETCVSIEWLYHIVRRDKERGSNLYTYLPHHLKHRRHQVSSAIPIKDRVSIDERPAAVDARSRFGDWEMDTIIGKDGKGPLSLSSSAPPRKCLWPGPRMERTPRLSPVLWCRCSAPLNAMFFPSPPTTGPSSPTTPHISFVTQYYD